MIKNVSLYASQEYLLLLKDIKERLKMAQIKTAVAINCELLQLYWEIGKKILEQQQKAKWGDKLLDVLEKDLKSSFPGLKGFSKTNLKYMRLFAEAYPNFVIGQTVSDQLPWSHHMVLLQHAKSAEERHWYMQQTLSSGWSFRVLSNQLKSKLYDRQAKDQQKTSNFHRHLPDVQSKLVLETVKDPYKFDFLMVGEEAYEREIEKGLVSHITKFLLELGQGFAFIGDQYRLQVADKEYIIDLLFYHINLRCFVIVELKTGEFKPEHAGKLNFYLSAADDLLRKPHDNPSIGLILCEKKDKLIAEYALKDIEKPIGVSEYTLMRKLPKKLRTNLPTIEEIEIELNSK